MRYNDNDPRCPTEPEEAPNYVAHECLDPYAKHAMARRDEVLACEYWKLIGIIEGLKKEMAGHCDDTPGTEWCEYWSDFLQKIITDSDENRADSKKWK